MPNTYIPVLRNGRNERRVIKEFTRSSLHGSLSRKLTLAPLVEVTDESDLGDIDQYQDAGEFVMVELPRYLTDRPNKYNEPVSELISLYGGVAEFYLDKSDAIDIPVVSGSIEPVDYTEHQPLYDSLRDEFDRVAVRLMLRGFSDQLTSDQKEAIQELTTEVRGDDILLFDLVDNGVNDVVRDDLSYLAGAFQDNRKAVMNAFDAYNDYPDNQSPQLADEIGATAFGDFGINQRFKSNGGSHPDKVRHRHYHPNRSTVRFFEGTDYVEAANELSSWSEWDRSHCDGCRRADRTSNNDPNTWCQIKMQHYFSSILADQI